MTGCGEGDLMVSLRAYGKDESWMPASTSITWRRKLLRKFDSLSCWAQRSIPAFLSVAEREIRGFFCSAQNDTLGRWAAATFDLV